MLTHLNIQGLAVIEDLDIEFSEGFNVITGETGAGKSILIKALSLLLGAKGSGEQVRRGFEHAQVWGTFELSEKHGVCLLLDELGVPFDKEAGRVSVLVRRRLSEKGRSQAWVNDAPLTQASLKAVGELLIDIFGQHDNQKLLNVHQHQSYLDAFLVKKSSVPEYRASYQEVWSLYSDIRRDVAQVQLGLRDRDFFQFRLKEVESFSPSVEDFQQIKELCQRGGAAAKEKGQFLEVQELLDHGVGGEALSKPLWKIQRLVQEIPALSDFSQKAADLAEGIDDLSFELGRLSSDLEVSEEELESGQSRLAGYQELMRKFGAGDIGELMCAVEKLHEEVAALENFESVLLANLRKLDLKSQSLMNQCSGLSSERRSAAKKVKRVIEKELHELSMAGARIEVEFLPVRRSLESISLVEFGEEASALYSRAMECLVALNELGGERAQFLLASNPGEPALPLQKIASGGEVSRIMLALKRALAAGADSCLLVFDEIDTGISGKVADVVGAKIKNLAERFQVICISHLPQVAAYADTHFQVSKLKRKGRTESLIEKLSPQASIEELARLLSGPEITKQSLANARQMVARAGEVTRA